ncbi:hypothetical protein ACFU9Y_38545 [Streptomyces sp. NPDC057621]|uniref:hypothetical protein n=1 Tax=Streptomyces sp. NPDC057621 TaxID=3346186 RepID=UPI0036A25E31
MSKDSQGKKTGSKGKSKKKRAQEKKKKAIEEAYSWERLSNIMAKGSVPIPGKRTLTPKKRPAKPPIVPIKAAIKEPRRATPGSRPDKKQD